ncbi:MAG: hypothetical protein Q8903_02640 [Bacteroidota bacterium]|nr:hypothetical protein [Bacteroidota bacterium]
MMEKIDTLRNQIEELRKQEKFSEAIVLSEELFKKYEDEVDIYDNWRYTDCLFKVKRYKEAAEYCSALYQIEKNNVYINNIYVWSLYHLYIAAGKEAPTKVEFESILKYAEEIIKLSDGENKSFARLKTCLKIASLALKVMDYETALKYIDYLNPSSLSLDEPEVMDHGRVRKLPSDKMRFYSIKSKALEKLGRYKECNEVLNAGIRHFPKDVWLKWRSALIESAMGSKENALSRLIALTKIKKEWFIYSAIAEIYMDLDDLDNALKNAVIGCYISLNMVNEENRWELFFATAKIFSRMNKNEEALNYLRYSIAVRKEVNWGLKPEQIVLADELGVDLDEKLDARELYAVTKVICEKYTFGDTEKMKGIIRMLDNERRFGFIYAEDGNRYYFKMPWVKERTEQINLELEVKFYPYEIYDQTKNQTLYQAKEIDIVTQL